MICTWKTKVSEDTHKCSKAIEEKRTFIHKSGYINTMHIESYERDTMADTLAFALDH